MTRFGKLLLCTTVLAAAATGANAATGIVNDSIRVNASSYVTSADVTKVDEGTPLSKNSVLLDGTTAGAGGGYNYHSNVDVLPSAISFQSSGVGAGPNVYSSSSSIVSFDFNNEGVGDVAFHSTITPAGLGFYMATVNAGCFTSCSQASGYDLRNLSSVVDTSILAQVGFDFQITDSVDGGEESQLYRVYGSLGLNSDGAIDNLGSFGGCYTTGESSYCYPGSGARSLDGFTRSTFIDPALPNNLFSAPGALGFAWGETAVPTSFLGTGVHHITYSTQVYSLSNAACVGPDSTVCLVAFSGFGDPIGRGGGADAEVDSLRAFAGGPIGGVNFSPAMFDLTYSARDGLTYGSGTGGVPEPATWAMMILGFGGIGATLRRRRTLGATI